MPSFPRLTQQIDGASRHNLAAMPNEGLNHLLEVQHLGFAIDQSDHIDAHHRLQLGLGVEVVQHHITDLTTPQFDHHAQTVFIGLVA